MVAVGGELVFAEKRAAVAKKEKYMGANTTYLFIDAKTMIVLAEFTLMFGLRNIGKVVHIAGKSYIVKSVKEHIFSSEDCIVEIMLDYDGEETPEVYDYNDYKKIVVETIEETPLKQELKK